MKKILTIAVVLAGLTLVSYPGLAQGDGSAAPAVYVAGNYYPQGEMGPTFPCYWKNGTRIDLSRDGLATGIAVSGGSVYVSGRNGYWKDKTKINFTGTAAQTTGIAVSGGSVYVSGWYQADSIKICYWKDGTRIDLPEADAQTTGIAVSDGSVYISGYYGNAVKTPRTPCYWKDGVRHDLPFTGKDGRATGIAVSDGSVYVAGFYGSTPCYWKDGTRIDLPIGKTPFTYGITVSGGSVYVAGGNSGYWKDGARIDFPETDMYTMYIAVSGGSVYVAGKNNWKPCYWKDGVRHDLPVTGEGDVSGIVVVE